MNTLKVVIPARYNSSRLPAKPLLELAGKPMFWHVVQRAVDAGVPVDDIVVATDDIRIYDSAKALCIDVEMTDQAHESGTDRVNEVAMNRSWAEDTFIVNVQGDEPLIPKVFIDSLIQFHKAQPDFDMVSAVVSIKHRSELFNPNVVKCVIGENDNALYFSRAAIPANRDNENCIDNCFRHVGIYGYSAKQLQRFCQLPVCTLESLEKLEQLRALSNGLSVGVARIDHDIPHGVDTYEDYLEVKKIMEL